MSHHTFTYRHSDLPAFRPEIKAEIIALGLHAHDLILKSHGNYLELKELAETLDNFLNTCQLNLNSIRIIPDDSPQVATITFQDLPIEEKQLIHSCARTNSILLNLLSDALNKPCEELACEIANLMSVHEKPVGAKEIEEFIETTLMPIIQETKKNGHSKSRYVFQIIDID